MTTGESGSPGRRAPSLWTLGTELSNRIAELCGLDACPPHLLHLAIGRLKRSSRNFRPKFPGPSWSAGLEIPNPPWPDGLEGMGGPIVINWQRLVGKILVEDWLDGDRDWTGWRKAAELLGMVDILDEDELRAVHGKTFSIEILDDAITNVVAELGPPRGPAATLPEPQPITGVETAPTPNLKALADAWADKHPTWGQRRLYAEWNETKLKKQGGKRLHPDRPHIGFTMFRMLPRLGRPRS